MILFRSPPGITAYRKIMNMSTARKPPHCPQNMEERERA